MWTWLINPKNLLIVILIAGCIVLGGFGLWYRAASAISASKAEKATAEAAELKAKVGEYERDLALIRAHSERLQQISIEAAAVQNIISKLQKRELTDEESAVAAAIGNRLWVLTEGGKILPEPGKASTD